MNEIIEELQEHSIDSPPGLEPPTEDDVLDAQEQIFLPFPVDFREFLLLTGELIVGTLEPATVADPNAHTYLPEICANAWDQGVPRHLIVFCEAPTSYYCLLPEGGVVEWRNGDYSERDWETIWEWARDVWLTSSQAL